MKQVWYVKSYFRTGVVDHFCVVGSLASVGCQVVIAEFESCPDSDMFSEDDLTRLEIEEVEGLLVNGKQSCFWVKSEQ